MPSEELDRLRRVRDLAIGSEPDPPPLFSRYEILGPLGEGASAKVYLARDRTLARDVALKVLRPGVGEGASERFRRESRVAAVVVHPNVVATYDAGDEGGRLFLVMERVEGRPLSTFLREKLPPRELASVLEKVCRGLAAAHDKGIVHRDLKPANILVAPSGEPKIADFGLAHMIGASADLTRVGTPLGTPSYMAPEQVEAREPGATPAVDLYALGAILYEGLTGRPPHVGATVADLYYKILKEEPLAPRAREPAAPEGLEAVALKALDKDPLRRYASAVELGDDLRRWLEGQPVKARRGRRFPRRLALAALLGAGAAAGAVAIGGRLKSEREASLEALRSAARVALDAALEARRAGANERMARYLPPLESAYEGAIARAPERAEPDYLLGRMRRALLEDGKALEHQRRALAREPDYAPALYEEAVLLSKAYGREVRRFLETGGRSVEAAERARPELARMRERVVADILRLKQTAHQAAQGLLAYARRDPAAAAPLLRDAVRREPALEEAWEVLALAVKESASAEKALEVYGEALARDRGYVPHYVGRSDLLLERATASTARGRDALADWTAAEKDLTEALRLRPGDVHLHVKRGIVRSGRGNFRAGRGEDPLEDWAAAEKDFGEALSSYPAHAEARARRGLLRTMRGLHAESREDVEAAERDFAEVLAVAPDRDAFLWRGFLRSRRLEPDLEGAESDLSRAIAIDADYWLAWRHRALARLRRDDLKGAEEDVAKALEKGPDMASAHAAAGLVRTRAGKLDAAERDFAKALEIHPAHVDALIDRGRLRLAKNRPAEAVADFEAAVRINAHQAPRVAESLELARKALRSR